MFEAISKAVQNTKGAVSSTAGSLFGALQKYFEPDPNQVRVRDVAREIPGQISRDLQKTGQQGLRIYGSLGSAISRAAGIGPLTPSTDFQKNLYGTDKPITFTSVGQEIPGLSTSTRIAPVAGFALAVSDLFPGGQGRRQALNAIARSKNAGKILSTLNDLKLPLEEASKIRLADELVGITKMDDVENRILSFVKDETQSLGRTKNLVDTTAQVRPVTDRALLDAVEPRTPSRNVLDLRERSLPKTLNPILDEPVIPKVDDLRYKAVSNKETWQRADDIVRNNIAEAYRIVDSAERSSLKSAVGLRLIDTLQNQARAIRATDVVQSDKLYDDAVRVVEKIAEQATQAGQEIQFYATISRLTPTGIVRYASKFLEKVNTKLPAGKRVRMTPELQDQLVRAADEIQALPDGRDKTVKIAEMLKLITDKVPPSRLNQIATAQTLAQLLNTKTLVRNLIGNLGLAVAEYPTAVFASAFDTVSSALFKTPRSVTPPRLAVMARGFVKGFKEGYEDAVRGINTQEIGTQFDLPTTKVFDNRVGAFFQKMLDIALRAPDRAFFQAAYDGSLDAQMRLAKVAEPTEEMKEIAIFDGMYRTFQDDNAASRAFVGLKRALNLNQEFGLGDVLLKYPKTPANLLNRGLAYSPAGFVKNVIEMARIIRKSPNASNKNLAESFGRAVVGSSALFGIGATLNKLGIISTFDEKDTDIRNVQREAGLGRYQINIDALMRLALTFDAKAAERKEGDRLVTYDWFQPLALPLVMGAEFNKGLGSTGTTLGKILSAVNESTSALAEQPLLKGVTNAFQYSDNLSDVVKESLVQLPSSFVPTLVNQIRQLNDNTRRVTRTDDPWDYTLNLVKNRIPGLAGSLEPSVSSFGRDAEIYQNATNNIWNVFFNPAFVTKYKPTPEAKLVLDLWNETGETKQFPRLTRKSYKVNGQDVTLTPEQVTQMQRFTGNIARESFANLANNPQFQQLTPEEKIDVMSKLLTAVGAAAKIEVLGDKPKKVSDLTVSIINQVRKTRGQTQPR